MRKKNYKPISLNGLRFTDKRGNFVVSEDHLLTFRDIHRLEIFINHRHRYWEDLLGEKLEFSQDAAETVAEIEVHKILNLVAKKMGVPIEKARSESTKEAVEVRRIAIKICTDRKVRVIAISKALGMGHDLVIYHRKKFEGFCETDKSYKENYLQVEDYVFSTLYGRFVIDGSGAKQKINNSEK